VTMDMGGRVNGTGWAIEKEPRPNKSNLITLRTRDW